MKILVVQTGFLGDVVLSSPVITQLRERNPDAELVLLTTVAAKPLVEFHPALDRVITFDKRGSDSGLSGLLRLAKKLRAEGFSRAYSLHKSYRTALLIFLSRIPIRYGFSEASASFLYNKTSPRKDLPHEVQRNLAILRADGVEPEALYKVKLSMGIPATFVENAESFVFDAGRKDLIAIAPGSVWETKKWTAEGFATVARDLFAKGYGVVMVGGPADLNVANTIAELSQVPLLNLVGKCDLLTSAAVINMSKILITNDSAPLHIAGACGTPVVALFCATVPEFGFGPWGIEHETLGVDGLSCRPCGRHGGNVCPTGTHACQKELGPKQVLDAVDRLIARQDDLLEIGRG